LRSWLRTLAAGDVLEAAPQFGIAGLSGGRESPLLHARLVDLFELHG